MSEECKRVKVFVRSSSILFIRVSFPRFIPGLKVDVEECNNKFRVKRRHEREPVFGVQLHGITRVDALKSRHGTGGRLRDTCAKGEKGRE